MGVCGKGKCRLHLPDLPFFLEKLEIQIILQEI